MDGSFSYYAHLGARLSGAGVNIGRVLETTGIHPREIVRFDLRSLMRRHGVTIAELADYMNVSQARVRAICHGDPVSTLVKVDYIEAVEQLAALTASEPLAA